MSRPSFSKTALITGASGGIGLELARVFARHGYDLVLVARNRERLESLAETCKRDFQVNVRVHDFDLSEPDSPAQLYEALKAEGTEVSALVNNAGFGTYGPFTDTDLNRELAQMQLNMVTLSHLCKLFLRDMKRAGHGELLNVASTAAFMPGPYMAVYFATKAYVLSFSEALAAELETGGVKVSVLCPGPTASDFQNRAEMHSSMLADRRLMMSTAKVAEMGFEGLQAGRRVIIPGVQNKVTAALPRLLPRSLMTRVVKRMQGKVA